MVIRRLAGSLALTFLLVAVLGSPQRLQAQKEGSEERPTCGPEIKEELAKLLAEKEDISELELYKKFKYCAEDGEKTIRDERSRYEYCGRLVYAGSTFYERMRCCGYEPQKMAFACPVEVRQRVGFGAFPVPGSYEYVLSCVDFGGGWEPVAIDRVHLTNAVSGRPDWYSAVIAKANEKLAELPLDGRTLPARSILSWNLSPQNDCGYQPIWGNVIEYQIRLDPTDVPPPPSGKIVFASSATYTGNLGNIAGAHAKCQSLASAAGLSGTFKAWISGRPDGFGGQNAADDLSHATVPYLLVTGTKVADDWSDLTDGSLDHAINRDENGASVSGNVWTNTETNGQAHDHRRDCGPGSALGAVWTSASGFESGRYGVSTASNSEWTAKTNTACSNSYRLYCFEQ